MEAAEGLSDEFRVSPFPHSTSLVESLKYTVSTFNSFPVSIDGCCKVHHLAAYLVSIRDQEKTLDNGQADTIVKLLRSLSDLDKKLTVFIPHFFSGALRSIKVDCYSWC